METALAKNPNIQKFIDGTPIPRIGQGSEVAAVIAFLLSDDASYVTGSVYFADGGLTA